MKDNVNQSFEESVCALLERGGLAQSERAARDVCITRDLWCSADRRRLYEVRGYSLTSQELFPWIVIPLDEARGCVAQLQQGFHAAGFDVDALDALCVALLTQFCSEGENARFDASAFRRFALELSEAIESKTGFRRTRDIVLTSASPAPPEGESVKGGE